jgi:hypothetical protein
MPSANLDQIPSEINEPSMHRLAQGFIAPSSVAMRLAPEVLLLELFREVFFGVKRRGEAQRRAAQELHPDILTENGHLRFSEGERAVIYSLEGRRKRTKRKSKDNKDPAFYAPAYPSIARAAWLGENRERTVGRLLFEEAFPQWLWSKGTDNQSSRLEQTAAVDKIVTALVGTAKQMRGPSGEARVQDLLAAAGVTPLSQEEVEAAHQNLIDITGSDDRAFRTEQDPLATRLCSDFLVLCSAEQDMPRILWLKLVMTFMRFALPMWFLSRLEITVIVRNALIDALSGLPLPTTDELRERICSRNLKVVQPSLTRSRLIYNRMAKYVRSRVELNMLLHCLEQLRPEELAGRKIILHQAGRDQISLIDLLRLAAQSAADLQASPDFGNAPSVEAFFARAGERFAAWRNPRSNGQGKNIIEFLIVLTKAEIGDEEGGHLLVSEGRADSAGYRVFPGPLLLQLVAFLAFHAKKTAGGFGGGGSILTLRDIESHFGAYGVDFSAAAETRPMLAKELQNLGLLVGSPDAGSSVGVTVPFLR